MDTTTLNPTDSPEGAVRPKKATDSPEGAVQPLGAADRRYFFEKLQRRYHDCVESAVACLVILQSKTRCRHEYALYTKVKHLLEAYDNLLSAPQLETLPSTQACHAEFYATRKLGHVSVCGVDELSETALHADYRENIVSACNTLATATDFAPNAETRAELVERQHVLYTATDITPDKKGKTREKRQT